MILGYLRASTGKQIRTLDAQRDVILRYAAMRKWESVEFIEDAATSGGMPFAKRPGGASIMEMVRAGKVEAVILPTLDRGFRVCSDALVTVDAWAKSKVALCVADFNGAPMDTSTPIGKMLLTMLAGFAEFEKARIAERTSVVLQQAVARGEVVYNPDRIPFGYMPSPANPKQIIESPDEQTTLRMMHEMHDMGISKFQITAKLKEMGRMRFNGKPIGYCTVKRLLNPNAKHFTLAS